MSTTTTLPSTDVVKRFISASKNGKISDISTLLATFGKGIIDVEDSSGGKALVRASDSGHLEIVSKLLMAGADVNARETDSYTALARASEKGRHEVVSLLLTAGADQEAVVDNGNTSLILASRNGHQEVVSMLLRAGANIEVKNNEGSTALLTACRYSRSAVVSILLAASANFEAQDADGNTSLIQASRYGHHEVVSALLIAGVNIEACNKWGTTALIRAGWNGRQKVVQTLLSAGANVKARDQDGNTALTLAASWGHHAVISMLLAAGASIEAKNNDGNTALMMASEKGHEDAVSTLLSAGANTKVKNKNGKRAADLAPNYKVSVLIKNWKKRRGDPVSATASTSESGSHMDDQTGTSSFSNTSNSTSSTELTAIAKGQLQDPSVTLTRRASLETDPQLLEEASRVQEQEESTVKIVLVGAGRAGKTALANSLLGKTFRETESTIGIQEFSCVVSEVTVADAGEDSGLWRLAEWTLSQLVEKLALAVLRPHLNHRDEEKDMPRELDKDNIHETVVPHVEPSSNLGLEDEEEDQARIETDVTKVDRVVKTVDVRGVVNADSFFRALGEGSLRGMKYKARIYDFGGQEVFYSVHHFFLTKQSVYLILFNMEWLVLGTEQEKSQCLSELKFWLNSVIMHTSERTDDGGFNVSPFAFVGTHKDAVSDPANHEQVSTLLESTFGDNIAWPSRMRCLGARGSRGLITLNFFPVDNTVSGRDPAIASLTRTIEKELDDTPVFHEMKPVTWFYFHDRLDGLRRNVIPLVEAVRVAEECGLDPSAVPDVLRHYHNLGFLMWHEDDRLRDFVVMDPVAFFVRPATTVICKHVPTVGDPVIHSLSVHMKYEKKYPTQWTKLVREGAITDLLLRCLLEEYAPNVDLLVLLMIKYGLIVSIRPDSEDKRYLIPALLPQSPVGKLGSLALDHSFWIYFTLEDKKESDIGFPSDMKAKGFLPDGLFERLIGRIFNWIQRTSSSEVTYEATKDFVMLFIGSQRVHISVARDVNCVRVDVQGASPVLVQDRVSKIVTQVVAECMRGLNVVYFLTYNEIGLTAAPGKSLPSVESDGVDTMFVSLDAVIEVLDEGRASINKINFQRSVQLGRLQIQDQYKAWSATPPVLDYVDVFISYRWGKRDEEFTAMLYDRLSKEVVPTENSRQLVMFLDKKRLKDGDQFREDIVRSLISTRVLVPIVSVDAMRKMVNHDATSIDNLILEWICACVCIESGRIQLILPIAFGDSQVVELKDLFQHPILSNLPKLVPTATISKAFDLLSEFGISCSLERLMRFTVHSLVNEYMFSRFLATCAWFIDEDRLIDECAKKVVQAVVDHPQAIRPPPSSEPTSSSPPVSSASPRQLRFMEPTTTTPVTTNTYEMTLGAMINRLRIELEIESENVGEVLRVAARALLDGNEEEYSQLTAVKDKTKFLFNLLS